MNLLEEINNPNSSIVQKTDETCNIPIDGIKKVLPVYRIKLSALFYNDKNDRIGTFINKYKSEKNIDDFEKTNIDEYNDVLESFIINSNKEAFKKTLANMEKYGQVKPGVVLRDGRVIDGNRRFTCLRQLSKTSKNSIVGAFDYFNAVILDESNEKDYRKIKILELMIQQGEDTKVDYDPIDKLVGIYNDIIKNKLLSTRDYANCINQDEKKVKNEAEISKLLADFLEFCGETEKFHLAREFKIDGPIREVFKILKKLKNSEAKYKQTKKIMFNILLSEIIGDGDRTRNIRKLDEIMKNEKYFNDILNNNINNFDAVKKTLTGNITFKEKIEHLKKLDELQNIKNSISLNLNKRNSELSKNKPIALITEAITSLEAIDEQIFTKLSANEITNINEQLEVLQNILNSIKRQIND